MTKDEALALAKLMGYVNPCWFICESCHKQIVENDGVPNETLCWGCFESTLLPEDRWLIVPRRGHNVIARRGNERE